jgi:hypothetical protein
MAVAVSGATVIASPNTTTAGMKKIHRQEAAEMR